MMSKIVPNTTAPGSRDHWEWDGVYLIHGRGRLELAVQSTLDKGLGQTTVEFKISLIRPITPETGRIKAEGIVLNSGRRVGTAEGRLTDGKGRLLAHGTTTCLIFVA